MSGGVRPDADVIREFLNEWKHGWASPSAIVEEGNRLSMQQQLFMLIASGGKSAGKERPRDRG